MKKCLVIVLAVLAHSCAELIETDEFKDGIFPSSHQISVPRSNLFGNALPDGGDDPDAASATLGLFSERVPVDVAWDTDTKLDIWKDWNGNMEIETMSETNTPDGVSHWKLTGTGAWLGMGIRSEPLSNGRDLSAFTNGSLRFLYRGLHHFKVGIKDVRGTERWVYSRDLAPFGFTNDGQWRRVIVPVQFFAGIAFTNVQQFFMFTANGALGYEPGHVYELDDIHYHARNPYTNTDYTPGQPPAPGGRFTVYADSIPFSVEWDSDTRMDIWRDWGANIGIREIQSDAAPEGNTYWKLTGTGSWMGMAIRVNPYNEFHRTTVPRDMGSYSNGSLVFWVRARRGVFQATIKSRYQGYLNDQISVIFLGDTLCDGRWRLVVCPIERLRFMPLFNHRSTLDMTEIVFYFSLTSEPEYCLRFYGDPNPYFFEGYKRGDEIDLDGILFTDTTDLADITNMYAGRELNLITGTNLATSYTTTGNR